MPEIGITIAKNAAIVVVGYTIIMTTFRTVRKFLSPRAKRKRTVRKYTIISLCKTCMP